MSHSPYHSYRNYWLFDEKSYFLNHGAFGACPIPVLRYQEELRQRMERQPLQFLGRDIDELLMTAKRKLADFVGTRLENIAFVNNATTGINTVLQSLHLCSGDEILVSDHEYNACRNALNYVAEKHQLRINLVEFSFPIASPEAIVDKLLSSVTPRTKYALIDHISSQSALIFPVLEIVRALKKLGVETIIDGAHAPGQIPINLDEIQPAFYSGNCHKWLCAPKGSAFLYVRPDLQGFIEPLTISHGRNMEVFDPDCLQKKSRFQLQFDWMGTIDFTPYLSIPESIKFMGSLLAGGWNSLYQRNHELAIKARQVLCQTLNLPIPCGEEFIASMAVIPLPMMYNDFLSAFRWGQALNNQLWDEYRIEVPIMTAFDPPQCLLRISCQIYNVEEDYIYLAKTLKKLGIERTKI